MTAKYKFGGTRRASVVEIYFSWPDLHVELAGDVVVWATTVVSILDRVNLTGSVVGFMIIHALEVRVGKKTLRN